MQIALQWLNHLLGNDGWTIDYRYPYQTGFPKAHRKMENLIEALESEKIDAVIIHKTNPLYSYPQKERLQSALKKAKLVILHRWTVKMKQELLQIIFFPITTIWKNGLIGNFKREFTVFSNPTIRPLYRSRAFEDALIQWAKEMKKDRFSEKKAESWYEYLKIQHNISGQTSWNQLLKTGVSISKPDDRDKRRPGRTFKISALNHIQYSVSQNNGFELVIYPTTSLKDGTMANVSWLQEFPDPVTKICWDNYICISPASAKKQNLTEGQLIQIKGMDGQELKAPVHIQPGQADEVFGFSHGLREKTSWKSGQPGWSQCLSPNEHF